MRPFEIKKDIWWVGVVDWNLRDFHGYETEKGSTYNAYLVKGAGKTVLFDTVKSDYTSKFIHNLKQVIEPEKIDYIVSNHAEMDHTGALPEVIEIVKPEKLFVTRKGMETLNAHFHKNDWPFEIVDKETGLDIGGKTIEFIGSPMLHWPESMVSYIPQDGLLISNDIFGQHLATSERFDDQVEMGELKWQTAKYYANIFNGVSNAMKKFIEKIEERKLDLQLLAVDHGVIWRKNIPEVLKWYRFWANQESLKKAVVVYDTMWGSTSKMANAIVGGLVEAGVSAKLCDLRYNHRSDVITEILDTRAIILGSPVLNKGILPQMGDFITYMKGLLPRNKIGTVFSSYGWNDAAGKILTEALEEIKVNMVDPGISVNYVPTHDDLKKCHELGLKVGKAILAG